MNTQFLSEEDASRVQSIMAGHGLSGFEASVRLWGRGKAIHVSGPLDRHQLSCLLDIARYLGDGKTDGILADLSYRAALRPSGPGTPEPVMAVSLEHSP